MNSKLMVLVVLATVITIAGLGTGAEKTAVPQDAKPVQRSVSEVGCLKIGVVSVRKIIQDCKRYTKSRQELNAEGDKIVAELEKLSKEIDLDKADLKTLKPGSSDYLVRMKEVFEKRAKLQAQQEYFKQQMDIRQETVVEQLFKDVLKATAEVAKARGLDLVLERSEPDLPAGSANELTLTISTHKVLYDAGCTDITNEVLARVDANSP